MGAERDRPGGNHEGLLGARRIVTLPNLLSVSRLLLLPVILLLLVRHCGWLALLLMLVCWATDGLDGWIARRRGEVSDLGRVLDHLVDKIWIGSVLVTLVYVADLPVHIAGAVILRDLLILAGSLVIMHRRGSFVSSNILGKITGVSFGLMIIYYTVNLPALAGAKYYVDFTITVLIVVSFLNYLGVFLRRMGKLRLPDDALD
ncbi:CDP-alcohol phosphatidyltransferase family protein [candidate division WOR-3 bacterium]|nr:CDP-alcohol phosphatidyltransferase family protein [candidate division WOR-3 bacterium]